MTASNPDFKRYNITIDKYDHPVPYETEHGQWVKYSSYKALQAEFEKLRKDAERYRWLIGRGDDFQWENIIHVDIEDFTSRDEAIDAATQRGTPC